MSNAANGLRLSARQQASGLSAEVLAIAIAGMAPSDLVANMTDEQKAAVTPPAPAASDEEAGDKPMKPKKGEKGYKDEDEDGDEPMAQDRSAAVFASEHTVGRERLAADCLAAFPSATASQITGFLAKQAKPEAKTEAAEGSAELAAAIRHNAANLGAGGEPEPKADSSAVWDRAIASNNPRRNR